MTDQIKDQLDQLINKKFNYQGKDIKITRYKNVTGLIVVFTDSLTYNFRVEEIQEFINSLRPILQNDKKVTKHVEVSPPEKSPQSLVTYSKSPTHIKLESSLSDMIDKVITDKSAIPQAVALCNIANTMVNIEKQQINFLKATNQL